MTKIDDLIIMNDTMIIYQTKLGIKPSRNLIIREMLKDRTLFKKLQKKDALIILRDIGVSEQNLETVYNDIK